MVNCGQLENNEPMVLQARLFGGRGWHWYDLAFLCIAAAIVYPDEILDWIASRTGKHFTALHLLILETIAAGSLVLLDWRLVDIYPKLLWWEPLLFVGMLLVFRVIKSAIGSSLGD